MPQLGIFTLYFIALISSNPPPHAAVLLPLIYATWTENTRQAITAKLRFAWLQSSCWSLCCSLAIFPNFFLQRPENDVSRKKGTRRRTEKNKRIFLS